MKQTTFTLLFFCAIALLSCRKDNNQPGIREYDDDQIKNYISANGISGMSRDTSGMYYKIIQTGSGTPIQYTDNISIVYSVRSVDGKFIAEDTVVNHLQSYVGHIASTGYPIGFGITGVQQAIRDILKYRGGSMRLLVPSRLAYGVAGAGSGSSSVATRIAGNQSLDIYIHVISDQAAYDKATITKFIAANNLGANVFEDPDGYWYNLRTPGTGTVPINDNSTVTMTYTVRLLNDNIVDQYNPSAPTQAFEIPELIKGVQLGLKKHATAGALLTFVIPSAKAYGKEVAGSVPANSVLRFEVQVLATSP